MIGTTSFFAGGCGESRVDDDGDGVNSRCEAPRSQGVGERHGARGCAEWRRGAPHAGAEGTDARRYVPANAPAPAPVPVRVRAFVHVCARVPSVRRRRAAMSAGCGGRPVRCIVLLGACSVAEPLGTGARWGEPPSSQAACGARRGWPARGIVPLWTCSSVELLGSGRARAGHTQTRSRRAGASQR